MRVVNHSLVAILVLIGAGEGVASAGDNSSGPDLSITRVDGKGSAGKDIVNRTGNHQALRKAIRPGNTAGFVLDIRTGSRVEEVVDISGPASDETFGISYRDGNGNDVTTAVTTSGYATSISARHSEVLFVSVTADSGALAGESAVLSLTAQDRDAQAQVDKVKALVEVPPLRTWAVNYGGSLRCTATFETRILEPGEPTGVKFTLTNLTDHELSTSSNGYLIFRDAQGKRLWDSAPKFAGLPPTSRAIGAHQRIRLVANDAPVRWSGPLDLVPICKGLRLKVPPVTMTVRAPGAPEDDASAIARALEFEGNPFTRCPPPPGGETRTGSIPVPDGRPAPSLEVGCWAEIRHEDGFDVVALNLVSPPNGPKYTIDENADPYEPHPLPGDGNFLSARWAFVVSSTEARPFISLTLDRTVGSGVAYAYELQEGVWSFSGERACSSEGFSADYTGSTFLLQWVGSCGA